MKRPRRDYPIRAEHDGLDAPSVGPWAVEKWRRLGMYAEMFSTGMKNHWGARVYIDLFAGSGQATIRDEGTRVLTSPLLALNVRDPFDKYIFCDSDSARLECLRSRVERCAPSACVDYVGGDANERLSEIEALIPAHTADHSVLSFCFVDPYALDIHFDTIRRLGAQRAIDFLMLLALGMDANRNWRTYLRPHSRKVDKFLADSTWRARWAQAEAQGKTPIRFLAEEYAGAMTRLGYLTPGLDRMHEVRTLENNMRLYYLAFFSKNELGYKFWDEVRRYSTDQLGLGL